eukprot:6489994-Amphidinium_carterae.1
MGTAPHAARASWPHCDNCTAAHAAVLAKRSLGTSGNQVLRLPLPPVAASAPGCVEAKQGRGRKAKVR